MTTGDDLISAFHAEEKKPGKTFSEFLLKLDCRRLELRNMFSYNASDESFRSVMSRALDLEQKIVYDLEVKKGSSLNEIRREPISIDVKNDRKQHRRQIHNAELNEYTRGYYDRITASGWFRGLNLTLCAVAYGFDSTS